MPRKRKLQNYDSVAPSRRQRNLTANDVNGKLRLLKQKPTTQACRVADARHLSGVQLNSANAELERADLRKEHWIQKRGKRGHAITFAGLHVFTFLVYFRPYELFPTLSWLSKSALVVALITLAAFIPTQLGLENRITAKPPEIKLVFALVVTGLLSVTTCPRPCQSLSKFY